MMILHAREQLMREAEMDLRAFIHADLNKLTELEKVIVVNKVANDYNSTHLKYELRYERHGCYHRKGGLAYEGECEECKEEEDGN